MREKREKRREGGNEKRGKREMEGGEKTAEETKITGKEATGGGGV